MFLHLIFPFSNLQVLFVSLITSVDLGDHSRHRLEALNTNLELIMAHKPERVVESEPVVESPAEVHNHDAYSEDPNHGESHEKEKDHDKKISNPEDSTE